ncbi:hypothetical protein FNV43_RR04502 [Rhamnella rubrinervis]|uniref:Uncharacterized protein n=1 Tax=Rhamnella rubrinervis TaxID=2594499 RepID=A0A8K0MQN3_9ROSA|nr:hypothetical protein FNV43_RR04502 [Rhamnella rubrinervis]
MMDRITLWYKTHFNKKTGKWSDVKLEQIYNQLIEANERCEAEGLDVTIDKIFNSVVPPKSGYVQGFGPGPKPMSRTLRLSSEGRRLKIEQNLLKKEMRS